MSSYQYLIGGVVRGIAYLRTSDGWGEGGWQPHMHRHVTHPNPPFGWARVVRAVVLRVWWCGWAVQLWFHLMMMKRPQILRATPNSAQVSTWPNVTKRPQKPHLSL